MNFFENILHHNLGLFLRVLFFVIFLSPFFLNKFLNFTLKISILTSLLVFFFPYLNKSSELDFLTQITIGSLLGLSVGTVIFCFELFAIWASRAIPLSFEAEYLTIKSKNSFQLLYLAVFLFLFSFFSNYWGTVFQFFIDGLTSIPLTANFNEDLSSEAVSFVTALFKLSFSIATFFSLPLFISIAILILCSAFVKKYFPSFKEKAVFSASLIQLVMLLLCYIMLNMESGLHKYISGNISPEQIDNLKVLVTNGQ